MPPRSPHTGAQPTAAMRLRNVAMGARHRKRRAWWGVGAAAAGILLVLATLAARGGWLRGAARDSTAAAVGDGVDATGADGHGARGRALQSGCPVGSADSAPNSAASIVSALAGDEACAAGAGSGCGSMCCTDVDTGWGVVLYLAVVLYCFLGLAVVCDDYFCESLDAISEALSLSEDVAGATFMAAGSSAPELFTAVVTILVTGGTEGLGTIVGSAVFNIMVIVGVTALCAGEELRIWWFPLARDCAVYTASIALLLFTVADFQVEWWEATILVIGYGGYIALMVYNDAIVTRVEAWEARRRGDDVVLPGIVGHRGSLTHFSAHSAGSSHGGTPRQGELQPGVDGAAQTAVDGMNVPLVPPGGIVSDSEMGDAGGDAPSELPAVEGGGSGSVGGRAGRAKAQRPGAIRTAHTDEEVSEAAARLAAMAETPASGFSASSPPESSPRRRSGTRRRSTHQRHGIALPDAQRHRGPNPLLRTEFRAAHGHGLAAQRQKRRKEYSMSNVVVAFMGVIKAKRAFMRALRRSQARRGAGGGVFLEHTGVASPHDATAFESVRAVASVAATPATARASDGPTTSPGSSSPSRGSPARVAPAGSPSTPAQSTAVVSVDESASHLHAAGYGDSTGALPATSTRTFVPAEAPVNGAGAGAKSGAGRPPAQTAIAEESGGATDDGSDGGGDDDDDEGGFDGCLSSCIRWESGDCKPQRLADRVSYWVSWPLQAAIGATIPPCADDKWAKWYMATFTMSIVWIGILSFIMVDFGARAGCVLGVPGLVMGLVVLAAGTSVPDALSSVLVARLGQGDMAVANVLGSNIFNILLGLGLPWLLRVLVDGKPFPLPPGEDVVQPTAVLLLYLAVFIGAMAISGWRLTRRLGVAFLAAHAVFVVWNLLTLLPDPVIVL